MYIHNTARCQSAEIEWKNMTRHLLVIGNIYTHIPADVGRWQREKKKKKEQEDEQTFITPLLVFWR